MALTKEKKHAVVAEITELLRSSKLTVVAQYTGTGVKAMQTLRQEARNGATTVRVVKNRLVKQAMTSMPSLKDLDVSALNGQLLYAFNAIDEVAPASALASFSKANPSLVFVGAIDVDGNWLTADDVKALAALPSKEQLRAQLVGILSAPISGFVNVMAGNLRGVINALNARAESM